ncbi:SurA N-terminal domain-containing protein [Marinivivus vitaminiproducens]|uniref:SurA N-terminal domain-containing protein n=1 Tax=Marinivivus vitaminiproducens TaxID=3035935 RepID=UPI00279DB2AB|nr:SurA N-terminal domain-containing protein [Geminicoccaceae bacterium SCSIO 64248]
MMNALRRGAQSWVFKGLLGILVLSFGVWGIGDIFRGSQSSAAITVGDREVTQAELDDAFRLSLQRLQERVGQPIGQDPTIRSGVLQQTVQSLVAQNLVDQAVADLGVVINDATVVQSIQSDPVFASGGSFDRQRFDVLIRQAGLTEQSYIDQLRGQLAREDLLTSLTAGVAAPDILVETLYKHRNEKRDGRALVVTTGSVGTVPEPTDDELETYHDANVQRYTAPEYRKLTVLALSQDSVASAIDIPEDEVRSQYEQRIAAYTEPERRSFVQLIAQDQAVLQEAADRAAAGEPLEEVGRSLADRGVTTDRLEDLTRDSMLDEVAAPGFDLADQQVSPPIETPFGWHLLQLVDRKPETVRSFEEVRDQLRGELAADRAADRLPEMANQLQDELAGGATLEEAAQALEVPLNTIESVDAQSMAPDGSRPSGLPEWPEVVEVAFGLPEGEVSGLEESQAGAYFVARADAITPSRVEPVEEVRDRVVSDWRSAKRREMAEARAEDLRKRAADGEAIETLAGEPGVEVRALAGLLRTDAGSGSRVNQAAVDALFTTAPRQVADRTVALADGAAVVVTDAVTEAQPGTDSAGVDQLRTEMTEAMQSDVLAQYENALRRRYPVEVNNQMLSGLIDPSGGDGSAGGGMVPPPAGPAMF